MREGDRKMYTGEDWSHPHLFSHLTQLILESWLLEIGRRRDS